MTPESQWEFWKANYDHAKKAVEVAQKELMRISKLLGNVSLDDMCERGADNMLAGEPSPVSNDEWPNANRTIPDVSGKDIDGRFGR